jgi:hypothetical protein
MKAIWLSFIFIYFSASALFKGLQPIQIKESCPFLGLRRSRARLQTLARPSFFAGRPKSSRDPTIQNEYHAFRLIARYEACTRVDPRNCR